MDVKQYQYKVPEKKKRKRKERVRVPPELEVLKGMNAEELLERYYFPNTPLESWYEEDELAIQLDQEFILDSPPPWQPRSPIVDVKTTGDLEVLDKLGESFRAQSLKHKSLTRKEIKAGDFFNILGLLFPFRGDYLIRRKGRGQVKARDFEGKYVMICCCYAPALCGSSIWTAVHGCSEMYSKLNGKFEMVVVIKTRPGWTHPRAREKDVFRRFFSAFPRPCLAVPFHDRSRRHDICYSVGLTNFPKILLVGPDDKALLSTQLSFPTFQFPLVPLDVNGLDTTTPFPFTSTHRNIISTPSSLKGLLFQSSESVFRKKMFKSGSSVSFLKEEVSLSDLNSKPVALYLYYTGETLPLLRHIAEGCRQTNKDLEVVVVYLPTDRSSPSFPEFFSTVLAKRELPWWVVPYNFSASTVLEHIFQVEITWERVIIIGPNDQYVDVRGRRFMQIYGVYAYPFSFDSVVQKTVEELRQVTLDSFLKLLQLQQYPCTAKKVLFYFDFPYSVHPSVYEQVRRFLVYEEVDMHFISIADNEDFERHVKNFEPEDSDATDLTLKLSWHTKGANKARDFFLRLFNDEFPTIVAFGEDGRICSLLAHNLPPSDGPELKGNLLEEVSSKLEEYLSYYDKMEYDDDAVLDERLAYRQELRQSQFW